MARRDRRPRATRRRRLERAHSRTRHTLHGTIKRADQRLPVLHREVALLERAAAVDTRGEHFAMTVGGQRLHGRTDAAAALGNTLLTLALAISTAAVAQLAGLTVLATALRHPGAHLRLELADVPRSATKVELTELATYKPDGLVSRLENRASNLSATRADTAAEIDRLRAERDRAADQLARPFPQAAALADARARNAALAVELTNPPANTGTQPQRPAPARRRRRRGCSPGRPRLQRLVGGLRHSRPRVVDDPHWPALSGALDRAESAGLDVPATLDDLTRGDPLPEQHPTRDLHYRLIDACPAAVTPTSPATPTTTSPKPGATSPTTPSRSQQLAAGQRRQTGGWPPMTGVVHRSTRRAVIRPATRLH